MNATVSLGISVVIFILILRGQFRGSQTPIKPTGVSLLLPILYISTSLFQLLDPRLHIQIGEVMGALLLGMVIAIPLIRTTNFEVRAGGTYFKRSKTVFVLLIAIFACRFILMATTTGIDASLLAFFFNLVTLSYITVWRIVLFSKFRRVSRRLVM